MVKPSQHTPAFAFLEGLPPHRQQSLLEQLRDLWTHTSTGLEGNSLTLGETKFVIEEGLTVSGKPLKDHQAVVGHAQAIDLLYAMLDQDVTEEVIFALHKAVQTEHVFDIYKPYGAWKLEMNGTYAVDAQGQQVFIEYAQPEQVPALMSEFIREINNVPVSLELSTASREYARFHMAFVHVHPFWDGNGRMARLLSNVPLLKAGLPPLLIPREQRKAYIDSLSAYQMSVGQLDTQTGLWPEASLLEGFEYFCADAYGTTQALVRAAH